ncbi:MAG: polysaccharide deacetylase [Eubacterium sp.]|nr:polysaccharide deacetylase [Eubacterium sp.]
MSDGNKQRSPQGLKEQRARRQRVNRIKTGILLFIAIWMSVCMVLNIYLMVRVSSLQSQIEILAEKMVASTQLPESQETMDTIESEKTQEESIDTDEAIIENSEDTETTEEASLVQPNTAIRERLELEDNLRSPEDPMTVYLTFDDGPSENTPEILEILKAHNVKATFFVTGKEEEELKGWYEQIVADGHTLGMHSYSHKYSTIYESVDAFAADFEALRDYVKELTGVDCKYYRFPGGSSNQVSNADMNEFIDYLGEQGMTYYDWNVVCGDATSQIYTADELVDNVMKDVVKYKYSVVLMHDATEKDTTVEALDALLQQLEAMNVEILPITEDSPVIHHNLN